MQNIMDLLVGNLTLPDELKFVGSCLALCLILDVFSLFVSVFAQWQRNK